MELRWLSRRKKTGAAKFSAERRRGSKPSARKKWRSRTLSQAGEGYEDPSTMLPGVEGMCVVPAGRHESYGLLRGAYTSPVRNSEHILGSFEMTDGEEGSRPGKQIRFVSSTARYRPSSAQPSVRNRRVSDGTAKKCISSRRRLVFGSRPGSALVRSAHKGRKHQSSSHREDIGSRPKTATARLSQGRMHRLLSFIKSIPHCSDLEFSFRSYGVSSVK